MAHSWRRHIGSWWGGGGSVTLLGFIAVSPLGAFNLLLAILVILIVVMDVFLPCQEASQFGNCGGRFDASTMATVIGASPAAVETAASGVAEEAQQWLRDQLRPPDPDEDPDDNGFPIWPIVPWLIGTIVGTIAGSGPEPSGQPGPMPEPAPTPDPAPQPTPTLSPSKRTPEDCQTKLAEYGWSLSTVQRNHIEERHGPGAEWDPVGANSIFGMSAWAALDVLIPLALYAPTLPPRPQSNGRCVFANTNVGFVTGSNLTQTGLTWGVEAVYNAFRSPVGAIWTAYPV